MIAEISFSGRSESLKMTFFPESEFIELTTAKTDLAITVDEGE
jgi:hypothetical protein